MKRLLTALFCVSLLTATVYLPVGCSTVTKEAATYYTLKDTWTAAHGAYSGWCELVVKGYVSDEEERKVDDAWNKFRAGYKVAIIAAQFNQRAPADVDLLNLQLELTSLIRKLSL